ncbi:hypothetical protein QR680_016871 [Steinernema hermaphroditum]|uniref:G-patch domain-containing protein n=1 Tax=Steinernema hermaphroditum TaxID=289476 RepID=A0AA39HEZ4_9BILA|nr:hypothetical protein QR680_016871 [Steinernema hermaphroditum]
MADDEGNEEFEINDSDLYYALNPHKRKRMSKEQQIYGVWADKEEEEEERPTFGSSKNSFMNFVSGGTQAPGQSKEEETVPQKKFKGSGPKNMKNEGFAGLRNSDDRSFGDWVKGSKGAVLMNMMKKMGYEKGKGLGASKQGIVEPVEAHVRPGRAAVGAYGSEGKGLKFGESAADAQKRQDFGDDQESEGVQINAPSGKWKKSGAKQKVSYKTVDEVLESDGGMGFGLSGAGATKIIDMTGPVQKVYNDYNAFSTRTKSAGVARSGFDVPELTHNLDLLLGMAENDIRRNNRSVQTLKDQNEALEVHLNELEEGRKKQQNRMRNLEQIVAILELFAENTGEQSLEDYKDLVLRLRRFDYAQFGSLSIDRCILSRILPVFVSYFSTWKPLDPTQSSYGLDLLGDWKAILNSETKKIGKESELCPFDQIMWNAWMPVVRRTALQWSPREATEPMTRLLETWAKILPRWMLDNLLDQVIFPRLHADVDQWSPTTDCIPIESWLKPWVNIMGDRLQPLLLGVRQKIGKALATWDARDLSAIHLLAPWKGVFSQGTMSAFVGHHIIPKLAKSLRGMEMDQSKNQHYHEFAAVICWLKAGLLSVDATVNVLLNNFFPKFYQTLCWWLDSSVVVRTEVSEWYTEWRGRFPRELLEQKPIKDQFLGVVQAMHQSLNGFKVTGWTPQAHLQPVAPEPVSIPKPQVQQPKDPGAYERVTFKRLLQRRAEEEQIPFTPLNRLYLQYQLYKCGDRTLYFTENMIFALDPETRQYRPIGVDDLIAQCQALKIADDEGNAEFEINDSDLYYALNPHKRKRMSKEQQIYGVWADKEEEVEERPTFGSSKNSFMNFVSGGTQAPGQSKMEETGPKNTKNGGFAGLRNSDDRSFGDWVKGSKGAVLMNMMKKMGYEKGKGFALWKVEEIWRETEGVIQNRRRSARVRWGMGFGLSGAGATKIIDMTGPVQKVYNDYNAFSTRTKSAGVARSGFDVPELTHNLNLLLEMEENDIRRNYRLAQNLKDQNEALKTHLNELAATERSTSPRICSSRLIRRRGTTNPFRFDDFCVQT